MNVMYGMYFWYNIFLNEKLMTAVWDTCQMHPYFPYITSMQSLITYASAVPFLSRLFENT